MPGEANSESVHARLTFAQRGFDADTHEPGEPTLIAVEQSGDNGHLGGPVTFSQSSHLHQAFRGRSLLDSRAAGLELPDDLVRSAEVLAVGQRGPIWV